MELLDYDDFDTHQPSQKLIDLFRGQGTGKCVIVSTPYYEESLFWNHYKDFLDG